MSKRFTWVDHFIRSNFPEESNLLLLANRYISLGEYVITFVARFWLFWNSLDGEMKNATKRGIAQICKNTEKRSQK